jgi:hypothetical protein
MAADDAVQRPLALGLRPRCGRALGGRQNVRVGGESTRIQLSDALGAVELIGNEGWRVNAVVSGRGIAAGKLVDDCGLVSC